MANSILKDGDEDSKTQSHLIIQHKQHFWVFKNNQNKEPKTKSSQQQKQKQIDAVPQNRETMSHNTEEEKKVPKWHKIALLIYRAKGTHQIMVIVHFH